MELTQRVIIYLIYLSVVHAARIVKKEIISNKFRGLNAVEIIQARGYPVEVHHVITEDGYILALYRIPSRDKQRKNDQQFQKSILLVHGLSSSAADWINTDNALSFVLADQGYDVWILNIRGSNWSQNHTNPEVLYDRKQFWNYSFHEVGYYDLPATIDYMLNVTHENKLFYLGHSQGSTVYAVLMTMRPEYNNKIILAVLFAPAVFYKNIPSQFIKGLADNVEFLQLLAETLGLDSIPEKLIRSLAQSFCGLNSLFRSVCLNIVYLGSGWPDPDQLNGVDITVMATNTPSSGSLKQAFHYLQLIKSGLFAQFDYGVKENLKLYNLEFPPQYNVSKITSAVGLFYGKNDNVIGVSDVRLLRSTLPNVVMDHLVEYELFNHIDFVFANDAFTLVYKDVLKLLNKYVTTSTVK